MLRLTLPQGATAAETEAEFERYARLQNLGVGLRRARALDDVAEPPPAGPRDLAGLATAMAGAHAAQAYYFHQPGWSTLNEIHQRASEALRDLDEQAKRTPQAAVQAARITSLAASLIARHAAQIQTYLNTWHQSATPGAEAMRYLTRAAEDHAARAAGIDDGQTLDTPRLLMAHAFHLNRELQRTETARPGPATDPKLDDPDDPALESALSLGALYDRSLAEAARLGDAMSELSGRARRVGHRAVLDVRLHGAIESLQIRSYEMISGIARKVMNRYDELGWQNDGRRTIAATIFHYAEQRLERIRGHSRRTSSASSDTTKSILRTATWTPPSTRSAPSSTNSNPSSSVPRTAAICRFASSSSSESWQTTRATRSGSPSLTSRPRSTSPGYGPTILSKHAMS